MTRKHLALAAAALLALAACTETGGGFSGGNAGSGYTLSSRHWGDVAKLRAEAQRLGLQVRSGKITRVQAAQYLNRYRLREVGANQVDDSVYSVYLRAAVDRQSGRLSEEQSRAYVENALKGWQQRWPHMSRRPSNPAFTNFLMEYMNMKPLQ